MHSTNFAHRPNPNTPIEFNWLRQKILLEDGTYRIIYFARVNDSTVCNVWYESHWRYAVIGFTAEGWFVGAQGGGSTMKECKIVCEAEVRHAGILPAQSTLWAVEKPLEAQIAESRNDLGLSNPEDDEVPF